jgi:hypothetical protein
VVEFCIHIANVVYLISFLARDILWLRLLTCVALLLGLVFFTCQPAPLYGPTIWHVAFLAINGVQISRLLVERRRLMLTRDQERLGQAAFADLTREQLLNLLTRVTCQQAAGKQREIDRICRHPLTKDEQVLRNIAFSRLSRTELVNLLTRRLWNFIKRRNPLRWGRAGRQSWRAIPADLGVELEQATR